MWKFSLAVVALSVACAQGETAGTPVDAPVGGEVDAEPIGARVDADPGAPDAPPRPDAGTPDGAPAHIDASPPDAEPPPPPDAAPGTPDATPVPDATPPTPDATPSCTVMQLATLTNGAFDSGTAGWTESGDYPIINETADLPITPQTGSYAAWLGGYNSATDLLYQTVTVPAGTTALRLTGYRVIGTDETSGVYDHMYFRIRSGAGVVLETFQEYTNGDTAASWTAFDLPVSTPYAGQTIQLYIEATTDYTLPTGFLLDSLNLEATVCL